ncbi:MAG: zf-HC2 domain-containing protein [Blastocatellales bacterium]
MSNNRGKNWFRFNWHPDEEEMLVFLDGEASERQTEKVRAHLEGCWACRTQRDKLDRAIAAFMDYCKADAADASTLPPRASLQFAERLRMAASNDPEPSLIKRWAAAMRWSFAQRRLAVVATACLLLTVLLALVLSRAELPVSAEELLQRTTQAETQTLSRVGEPVVYRKLQVKRVGAGAPVVWESWSDARRNQFRQRVTDKDGLRFLHDNDTAQPALLAEMEKILRVNHFDPKRPLSAAAFADWRKTFRAKSEIVTEIALSGTGDIEGHNEGLKLTTIPDLPQVLNTITEASLVVRKSDWHTVSLELKALGEREIREYEISETDYEVLPLQALTVFADLPPLPTPTASHSATPAAAPKASPSPIVALPSIAALQTAEVAALYALHQVRADLGEQIEVLRNEGRQIVVHGLAQTAARKAELLRALSGIALVSAQIQTVEEAVLQAQQKSVANTTAPDETAVPTYEISVPGGQTAAPVNPFQQYLVEHFGGRAGLGEAERQEVNRKVTQFYNAIETDASAAMSEAWALRRLQERFAAPTGVELDAASRQRLEEMFGNHMSRLRRHSHDLLARLRPLLASLAGKAPAPEQAMEHSRQAQILAVFRVVEQVRRLTDQLIGGDNKSAAAMRQTANALLTELARLDNSLSSIEK